MEIPKADYTVGGIWGDAIQWNSPEQFNTSKPYTSETKFSVVGWKQKITRVGETLVGEFERSFMLFKFVSVRECLNPSDMFFAEVSPIQQVKKEVISDDR